MLSRLFGGCSGHHLERVERSTGTFEFVLAPPYRNGACRVFREELWKCQHEGCDYTETRTDGRTVHRDDPLHDAITALRDGQEFRPGGDHD